MKLWKAFLKWANRPVTYIAGDSGGYPTKHCCGCRCKSRAYTGGR